VYLDEVITDDAGGAMFVCSDTDHCERAVALATENPATEAKEVPA
jgi:alpha-D-ribose 1-methylphosphonate 5-phosphate C-P lyase